MRHFTKRILNDSEAEELPLITC